MPIVKLNCYFFPHLETTDTRIWSMTRRWPKGKLDLIDESLQFTSWSMTRRWPHKVDLD